MKNPEKESYFKNRKAWRKWLEKNYEKEDVIWIIYYKKHTGKDSIGYDDAVEEALCFGWIDGKVNRLDEERYKQRFSQRRKGSIWSVPNIKRVAKMIKEGLMTDAGLAKVNEAKENGEWEKALLNNDTSIIPEQLEAALKKDKKYLKKFMELPDSHKKHYIWMVRDAKRETTRAKRIEKILGNLKNGKSPGEM